MLWGRVGSWWGIDKAPFCATTFPTTPVVFLFYFILLFSGKRSCFEWRVLPANYIYIHVYEY